MKFLFSLSILIASLMLLVNAESQAQMGYQMANNGYEVVNTGYQVANTGYQVANDTPGGNVFRRIGNWSSGQPTTSYYGDVQGRNSVYAQNEQLPLGGLFAPDFELTANVFGGWNRIVGLEGLGDTFDDDFAVGIAYGRRHSHRLRSEFEFTYRSNDSDALGSVDVYSIMKNFIVDFQLPNRFATPYVGIGIGYANVDTDFSRIPDISVGNSGAFAYQPIAGVSLKLWERLSYYVEYRYFSTTDLEVSVFGNAQDDVTYNAHNLFMGLRTEF